MADGKHREEADAGRLTDRQVARKLAGVIELRPL
jgi:hypothetical protein